eukprot:184024_1
MDDKEGASEYADNDVDNVYATKGSVMISKGSDQVNGSSLIRMDIATSEQEDKSTSNDFDEMFVQGEYSVSKSDQNKDLDQVTTEGAEDQKFHGTKGDYYDEYNHQKYKERLKPKSVDIELGEIQHHDDIQMILE